MVISPFMIILEYLKKRKMCGHKFTELNHIKRPVTFVNSMTYTRIIEDKIWNTLLLIITH